MRTHIDGIVALIPPAITVYVTDVPDAPTFPYALITAPTFMTDSDVMSNARVDVNDYFQVTACGTTDDQSRWCQEKVRTAMQDGKPTVSGYNADTKFSATGIHAVDRDQPTHIYYAVDTYRYHATPA